MDTVFKKGVGGSGIANTGGGLSAGGTGDCTQDNPRTPCEWTRAVSASGRRGRCGARKPHDRREPRWRPRQIREKLQSAVRRKFADRRGGRGNPAERLRRNSRNRQ